MKKKPKKPEHPRVWVGVESGQPVTLPVPKGKALLVYTTRAAGRQQHGSLKSFRLVPEK